MWEVTERFDFQISLLSEKLMAKIMKQNNLKKMFFTAKDAIKQITELNW